LTGTKKGQPQVATLLFMQIYTSIIPLPFAVLTGGGIIPDWFIVKGFVAL